MKSLFCLLALAATCGIAGAPRNALGFEFAQEAVVDALHSIVYMIGPGGRIDAVNLSTGDVIATSVRAAKPLLLYDDVLLAEAKDKIDVLSVTGLTAKNLKAKFEIDLPLPSRV